MAFKKVIEDGITRVCANAVLSDGEELYIEHVIEHDPNDEDANRQALETYINNIIQLKESTATIVSITETE